MGQTWSPTNPRQQKDNNWFASYTMKKCKCKQQLCDPVPPEILTFEKEVWDESPRGDERESQKTKAEIKSLQRDFESTQESLNNRYEINLNSNPGVHVDDSLGTSTSSVNRVTEPAVSHRPQAGR